jgi:hypothetical protein
LDSVSQALFLSYSRDDLQFATQLSYSLRACGHKVSIDHSDLHGGEAWRARLRQLIIETDTVVFVLSPSSAASEVCRWEVDQAVSLAKRIIPVVCRALGRSEPHPALRELNYIFFYPEPASPDSGFGKGLATLVDALSQDIEWLRDHTRLTEMAVHWDRTGRSGDLLLRGSELEAFRNWRARRPASAPPLTGLQQSYVDASDMLERELSDEARQRLADMAAAQAERERALQQAEQAQHAREQATRKLVRRTIAGIAVAVGLSLAVIVAALMAFRNAEQAKAALAQATAEQLLQDRMLQFANNRADPEPPFRFDVLARRYEGQDPDHVGSDDFDVGHFYGTYRIRAGANMYEFLGFLATHPHLRAFSKALEEAGGLAGADVRDQRFVAAWQQLASDPTTRDGFAEAQRDFVKQYDYERLWTRLRKPFDPAADPSKAGLGIDICQRSLALQAVVFSIAVQYGPATPVPIRALSGVAEPAALSDRELIEFFYSERDKVADYFPALSERYSNLIRLRNEWEKRDAMFILDHGAASSDGTGVRARRPRVDAC